MNTERQTINLFDAWGPILDARVAAPETIRLFKLLAKEEGMPEPEIEKKAMEYDAVCKSDPRYTTDGAIKKRIIDSITEVTNPAFANGRVSRHNPNFDSAFYNDGLATLGRILDSGDRAMIFSSASTPWFQIAMDKRAPGLWNRLNPMHLADKTKVIEHETLAKRLIGEGYILGAFTDDEPSPMKAALQSQRYNGYVFIDRTGKFPRDAEEFRQRGAIVVNNLSQVNYRTLARRQ